MPEGEKNVLEVMMEQARSSFGCVISTVIAGPILLLIGVLLLASPNYRKEHVDQYNTATTHFQGDERGHLEKWIGTVNGYNFSIGRELVPVQGNLDGVQPATSVFAFSSYVRPSNRYAVELSAGSGPDFTAAVPRSILGDSSIYCSRDSCSSSCSNSRKRVCRRVDLAYECIALYGASALYRGQATCTGSSHKCGRCEYIMYLETACFVTERTAGDTWQRDLRKQSCYYPFKNQKYSPHQPRDADVTVELRSNKDPYIVLQEITKGKNDFGLTRNQQTAIAISLNVMGAILLLLFCGCCYYLFTIEDEEEARRKNPQHRIHSAPPPMATHPNHMPPTHGCDAPGYEGTAQVVMPPHYVEEQDPQQRYESPQEFPAYSPQHYQQQQVYFSSNTQHPNPNSSSNALGMHPTPLPVGQSPERGRVRRQEYNRKQWYRPPPPL